MSEKQMYKKELQKAAPFLVVSSQDSPVTALPCHPLYKRGLFCLLVRRRGSACGG